MTMMDKATGPFVFCLAAIIVIGQVSPAAAILEPFASQFIAKKMMLKHKFAPPPSAPQPATGSLFFVGQYQPQPSPPPNSYPAVYGPPPPSYPAYGPPSAYEPPVVVKPYPPPPPIGGCLSTTNPSPPPSVDYSNYAPVAHGGHGYGSNYGK